MNSDIYLSFSAKYTKHSEWMGKCLDIVRYQLTSNVSFSAKLSSVMEFGAFHSMQVWIHDAHSWEMCILHPTHCSAHIVISLCHLHCVELMEFQIDRNRSNVQMWFFVHLNLPVSHGISTSSAIDAAFYFRTTHASFARPTTIYFRKWKVLFLSDSTIRTQKK